jgi:hypothetical protein
LLRDLVAGVFFAREISQCHDTHDTHIVVHNRKIIEMMLAHNLPCLIHRLIFEAIKRFFYHDFANKRRLGIMAKAGSLPLRVLAFDGPNKMITDATGNRLVSSDLIFSPASFSELFACSSFGS